MLTIEDGTAQVFGAESYVTAAEADTYHGNRNNTGWAGTEAVKEAALRRAAAYLDCNYRLRWKGQPVNALKQPMAWPRRGVRLIDGPQLFYDVEPSFYDSEYSGYLDITTIPQRLKDAQCELALRALAGDLAVDGENNVTRKKIDVIETEFVAGTVRGQKQYQIVDQLLSDLVLPVGSGTALRG